MKFQGLFSCFSCNSSKKVLKKPVQQELQTVASKVQQPVEDTVTLSRATGLQAEKPLSPQEVLKKAALQRKISGLKLKKAKLERQATREGKSELAAKVKSMSLKDVYQLEKKVSAKQLEGTTRQATSNTNL